MNILTFNATYTVQKYIHVKENIRERREAIRIIQCSLNTVCYTHIDEIKIFTIVLFSHIICSHNYVC